METITKVFWVKNGTLSLPGKMTPFWGLSMFNGLPQVPGPKIETIVGDTIRIILFNNFLNLVPIGEPVSLIFPGQDHVMVKDIIFGTYQPVQPQFTEGEFKSLTDYVETGNFISIKALIYRFEAAKAGIYLFESGTNAEKQIQMGVYGVILIRPEGYNAPDHPNYKTAYGAGTRSEYDVEKVLVIGELDSVMHDQVVPNVYYNMLQFKPDYWVINGRSFPDTLNSDLVSNQPYGSQISCQAGDRVLLRVINTGFQNHTFYFGGLIGRVVAEDSFPLVTGLMDGTYEKTGITLGSGQSVDVILTPTTPGEIYLYDRDYKHLVNQDQFPGGMMTRIVVSP